MMKEHLLQQQQPQAFDGEIVNEYQKDTPIDEKNESTDTINTIKSLLLGLEQFIITILWPGLGLLSESYILFSIGTLHPIYTSIIQYICSYNTNNDVVNDDEAIPIEQQQQELLQSIFNALPYTICTSIIVGMIVLGISCDIYGRRIASIVTASCMLLGCIIATSIPLFFYIHIGRIQRQHQKQEFTSSAASYKTYQTYLRIFVTAMNLFAFGVGGEYPVSASSATESSMKEQKKISTIMMMTGQQQQQHQSLSSINKNGKHIQLIFSMQGVGILLQVIVLTVLLLILQIRVNSNAFSYGNNDDENNNNNNNERTFQLIHGYVLIWLIIYCIGTLLLCIVTITRYIHLQESTIWLHTSSLKSKSNLSSLSSCMPQAATTTQVEIVDANHNQCHEKQSQEQLGAAAIAPTTRNIARNGDNWDEERDKVNTMPVISDCNSDVSSLSIPSVTMLRQDDDEHHDRIIHNLYVNNDEEVQVNCINYRIDKNDNTNPVSTTGAADIDQNHLYNMEIPSSSFQQLQCLTPLPTEIPVMAVHPKDTGDANNAEINRPVLVEKYRWTVLLRILLYHTIPRYFYSIRLCSVSMVWFLWDITFYGNKLFQSSFLLSILSSSSSSNINGKDDNTTINGVSSIESMIQLSFAATINAIIAFCGYIVAAYIIDIPTIGRRNLQLYGLLVTGILFVGVGFLYDTLPTYILIVLYFGTSFFGQCGPNATTFILPSEIFPTQVRTICHGIAAASGKFGALVATILFHSVLSNQHQQQEQHSYNTIDLFLLSGYTSFFAAVITFWFIPETVCHDLSENDQYWEYVLKSYKTCVSKSIVHRNGDFNTCIKSLKYHQNPKYLSLYEQRQQLLRENAYDANFDDFHQQYTTLHHDDSLIYA